MAAGQDDVTYRDLLYVRRRFITRESIREAIAQVVNATLRARHPGIWGEGTTACAADSKQFGAWDQNLMTEWHVRYGGRGVMIYWHVERHSTCIYSQLKTPSSSEVAAMIEGVLRHWAERRCLRLLLSARVPPSATAQAHPCPAALSPDRRRTRCLPGIATSAVAADRLGPDPSPVQRDGDGTGEPCSNDTVGDAGQPGNDMVPRRRSTPQSVPPRRAGIQLHVAGTGVLLLLKSNLPSIVVPSRSSAASKGLSGSSGTAVNV
jgi:Tn3 transposase DDE domain-containing protein